MINIKNLNQKDIIDNITSKMKEIILVNSLYLMLILFVANYCSNTQMDINQNIIVVYIIAFVVFVLLNIFLLKQFVIILEENIISNERIKTRIDTEFLDNKINHILSKNLHHEIKTPISSLNSAAFRLEHHLSKEYPDMEKDNKIKNFLEIIKTGTSNINSTLSTIQKFNSNKQYTNLYSIINRSSSLYCIQTERNPRIIIENSFKEIDIKFEPNVLSNILINHIKNSSEAKATIIKFELVKTDIFIDIHIIDNGTGVPNKNKNKIYDLNWSNKTDTSEDNSSTGIGLYICKHILNRTGGDDSLVYSDSFGSIFKVRIPNAKNI